MPGVLVIINIRTLTIVYMSPMGRHILGVSEREITGMHMDEYNRRFLNPPEAKEYIEQIAAMLLRNNNDETISFFQQVRPNEYSPWKWYLSSVRICERDADGQPLLVVNVANEVSGQYYLTNKIERLLKENNFLRQNGAYFASLSKREKEILALAALGKTSKEIALQTSLAEQTVETHRKNIKRKLCISTQYELAEYARAFDLI